MSATVRASSIAPSGSGRPADYWQQEVNYEMQVSLRADLRTIVGNVQIEYINNSPDSLKVIYFKAFPNAIRKDSYADKKRRSMNDYSLASLKPEQEGRLTLDKDRSVSRGEFTFENSIITYHLDRPLPPNDSARFEFDFTTVLPSPDAMRMGYSRQVTKAAYWYPQVCVYDWKLGWVNSQYIGWGESYGDFGNFDVAITAPENQVVAATGQLVNEAEVLPGDIRSGLDIKNYLLPRSEWPNLNLDKENSKTWHYVAENVPDFVFTASSEFCIDSGSVNGVRVVSYPLRSKAAGWVDAVRLGKKAIETFSELYFPYQWPVIRICDAYGGMEYPMLTNCSGKGPSPFFSMLLYHEIGHQWFMGQVASNPVDRPFLDEGFTTHAEHNAMEKYRGRAGNYVNYKNWYQRKFAPLIENRNARGFRPLYLLMKRGYDKPMTFSFDQGEEYWTYRVSAYYKSAAMHYSLRSIFGDSLYYRTMHQYCDRWFFGHPYENDFTAVFEEVTGTELDNYLQQWYYGRKRTDYAYTGRSRAEQGRYYEHKIKLRNKGRFVSPIDVAIIWKQGDTTLYTVSPEGMAYAKPGYVSLPVWPQFRNLNREYEFTVRAQREIKKIVIDPFNLLVDLERRNNSSDFLPPIELKLDNMKFDRTPLYEYALRWRPDLWYTKANGVEIGAHWHGSYLEVDDRISLDARVGTESVRPFIDFRLSDQSSLLGRNGYAGWRVLRSDRRTYVSQWFEKRFQSRLTIANYNTLRLEMNSLDLSSHQLSRFQPLPSELQEYLPESTWDGNTTYYMNVLFEHSRTFRYGTFFWETAANSGLYKELLSHRGFVIHEEKISLALTRKSKNYLELSLEYLGTTGVPPSQFIPHLSRASAAYAFVNAPLFRGRGTIPEGWTDNFYLSGSRVRGYQDRNVYLTEAMSGSLELIPPDLLPYRWFGKVPLIGNFLSGIDQSFFCDLAVVSLGEISSYYPAPIGISELSGSGKVEESYLSAGLSIRMPPVWSDQSLQIDFPFYLNKPAADESEFEFRLSFAWSVNAVRR
ncbi:MAG: M1 family metallopeptidase [bacterium]|nr:M1 family metallopeptidase [bacterium]